VIFQKPVELAVVPSADNDRKWQLLTDCDKSTAPLTGGYRPVIVWWLV